MFNKVTKKIGNIGTKIADVFRSKSYTGVLNSSWLRSDPTKWNAENFLNAYEISLYTNKAVEKRAEKVGEIDFKVVRGEEEVEDHPLLDVLRDPNDIFTGSQFWALFQKYKDLTGSAYILLDKEREFGEDSKITGMHLLRPDRCKPNFDDVGKLQSVEFRKFDGSKTTYDADRILYHFRPDPKRPLEGVSLLKAGANAIDTERQISEYHNHILKNSGQVDGVFQFKTDRLTETQLQEVKDSYKKQVATAKKSGTPLFLGGDAEYKRLGLTPEELSFLETKKATLNDIVILTGVPKVLLASTDDVKFSNAEQSFRIFLSETIRPQLKELTDFLNEKLFEDEDDLTFVDPTPKDKDQLRQDLETANTVHALTINEYREELGYDPIDDGDQIFAPMNTMPLMTGSESDEDNENRSIKTKSHESKSPACRLEDESVEDCVDRKVPELIDEGMDEDQAVAVANEMCEEECANKNFKHPLRSKEARRLYERAEIKRKRMGERRFKKALDDYLEDQKERVLSSLDKGYTKDILDEVFNLEAEVGLAKEAFIPVIEEIFKESGESGFSLGDADGSFSMTPDIKSSINKRAEFFSRSMNETTFDELKDELQQSIDEGENRNQLIRRLSDRYDQISEGRANTITRTETLVAVESGKHEGYKQAGIPIKIWVASFINTRDTHADMDGQEVPIDQPFQSPSGASLNYPGDSTLGAPAEEVINCQCSI